MRYRINQESSFTHDKKTLLTLSFCPRGIAYVRTTLITPVDRVDFVSSEAVMIDDATVILQYQCSNNNNYKTKKELKKKTGVYPTQ